MIYSIDPNTGQVICSGVWPTDPREALEETRRKYEFLSEYLAKNPTAVVPTSAGNCACCIAARRGPRGTIDCDECLIGLTGHRGCRFTPWEGYYAAERLQDSQAALAACRKEVLFIDRILTILPAQEGT